jgi:hypothetical protein
MLADATVLFLDQIGSLAMQIPFPYFLFDARYMYNLSHHSALHIYVCARVCVQ